MSGRRTRAGKDWLITSFAVAIVGGTGLAGGRISALGLLLGAVIIEKWLGDAGGQRLLRTGVFGVDYLVGRGGEPGAGFVWGAGRELVRLDAIFLTRLEILVDGAVELTSNPLDIGCFKGGNRISTAVDDSSVKTSHGIVELDFSSISLVLPNTRTGDIF